VELKKLLEEEAVDVALLQEVAAPRKIPGFHVLHRPRERARLHGGTIKGGGVMTLVRAGIPFSRLTSAPLHPLDDTSEWLGIRVLLKGKKLDVHNLYLPPIRTGPDDDRVQHFDPVLLPNDDGSIIAGDLNAHHHLWDDLADDDDLGTSIADWCVGAEWMAANSGIPTFLHRGAGGNITPTSSPDVTLGHRKLLRRVTWRVAEDAGSDHLPCCITVHNCTSPEPEKKTPQWSYDKADWEAFRKAAEEMADKWRTNDRLGKKCDILHNTIMAAAIKHIPRGLRKQAKCWWNDEVDLAVRDRRIARAIAQNTRRPEDQTSWNRANKASKRVILESKQDEWRDFASSLSSATAPAKIHRVFKAINNNAEPRRKDAVLEITRPDGRTKILSTDRQKADAFVDEYARVNHLKRNQARDRAVKAETETYSGICGCCAGNKTDMCQPFTKPELKRALWTLKTKKAPGPDGVSNEMLKWLGPRARNCLLDLINHSWASGEAPARFKKATIVPIAKPGKPPGLIGSYRPIALMSCVAKLMEKMVARRLNHWLETNGLLTQAQAGFRACRSTEDQIARIVQTASNGFQARPAKRYVLVLFDFSRAYDRVWRKGLLLKLHRMGASGCLIKWLRSFLSGRQCQVRFNTTTGKWRVFRDGLPQGSSLAPVLFLIFIDDVVRRLADIPDNVPSLFADDLAALVGGDSLQQARDRAQIVSERLTEWADDWKCVIAPEKTELCALTTAPREVQEAENLTISVRGLVIHSSRNPCFLGVTFDRLLHFGQHVDKKVAAAKFKLRSLRALAGTSWGCDYSSLRGLYLSHIRAGLEYAGGAWMSSIGPSTLSKLEVVQRDAARTITGCVRSTPVDALMQEAHLVPIATRGEQLAGYLREKNLRRTHDHPNYNLGTATVRQRLKSVRGWKEKAAEVAVTAGIEHLPREPLRVFEHDPPWLYPTNVSFNFEAGAVPRSAPATARRLEAEKVLSSLPPLIVCAWSDGSVGEGGGPAGGGARIEWTGADTVELREAAGAVGSSYSAEAVALRLALTHLIERLRDRGPTTGRTVVACCTDSLSVLQRLKGHPGPEDSNCTARIRVLIRELSQKAEIHLIWVPGHAGVDGNEAVDAVAKEAAGLPQGEAGIPYACAKARIRASTTRKWRNDIRRDWHYRVTAGNPPKVPRSLTRLETRTLAQIRTGHSTLLAAYRKRIGVDEVDTCPACGEGPEDAEHLLLDCANWMAPRLACLGTDPATRLNDGPAVLRFLRKIRYLN
jgi:ribonuclease HI